MKTLKLSEQDVQVMQGIAEMVLGLIELGETEHIEKLGSELGMTVEDIGAWADDMRFELDAE